MTFNGEMALILRYFTEFGNGPYEPAEVRAAQSAGYCIYSKADFEDFRPAGATHCTDQGRHIAPMGVKFGTEEGTF